MHQVLKSISGIQLTWAITLQISRAKPGNPGSEEAAKGRNEVGRARSLDLTFWYYKLNILNEYISFI